MLSGKQNIRFINKMKKKRGCEYTGEKTSEIQTNIQWRQILNNKKRSKNESGQQNSCKIKIWFKIK